MNIAIALIVFFVLALICWAIAERNYKGFAYKEDIPHHPDPTAHHDGSGHQELNIRDIMRDNSTRGFDALPSSPEDAK